MGVLLYRAVPLGKFKGAGRQDPRLSEDASCRFEGHILLLVFDRYLSRFAWVLVVSVVSLLPYNAPSVSGN
jgi:hypothetical protein